MSDGKKERGHFWQELRSEDTRTKLLEWWQSVCEDRAECAQLRRCETPLEVALCKSVQRLRLLFPYWNASPEIVATMAGILAHVKENDDAGSFAMQLARPKEAGGKPPLSEHRFQKLMKSRTWNEFYQALRRSLQLLHGRANVLSLADGIARWGREHAQGTELQPGKGLHFFWSQEFFTEYLRHETK